MQAGINARPNNSACDAPEIRERIEDFGRKHIIDANPRRDSGPKKRMLEEARARRLLNLTAAEAGVEWQNVSVLSA